MDNIKSKRELENAICEKTEISITKYAREHFNYPENIKEDVKNIIEGTHAPKYAFYKAIAIRVKYYLLPLIHELIQIETTMRKQHNAPFSENRITELRNIISEILNDQWHRIVNDAFLDAENHEIFHMNSIAKYKEEELQNERNNYLTNNSTKDEIIAEFNRFLQEASADVTLHQHIEPRIPIAQEIVMGDKFIASGMVGIMGPNAHVHDISCVQTWNQMKDSFDLALLAEELQSLRNAMKQNAVEPSHDISIGAVATAEQAAKSGDGPKVIESLKSAGKWALDVAEKIGVGVATAAIKNSLGI